MRRNVLLNPVIVYKENQKLGAYGKSRTDMCNYLAKEGFVIKNVRYKHTDFALMRALYKLIAFLKTIRNLSNVDNVWICHPMPLSKLTLTVILRILKQKKCNICFIVMDLDSIWYGKSVKEDCKYINYSSFAIVHTDNMKQLLQNNGVQCEMQPLYFFPYYTEDVFADTDIMISLKNTIAYAGSIEKSFFIPALLEHRFSSVQFRFYGGKPKINIDIYEGKKHVGRFSPENVSAIQAGWGLVWDGDRIDKLCGLMGEYEKYNSPHKFSLYTVAGIPLIAGNDSAFAPLINEKKIGITVNSLTELDEKIGNMSEEEYKEILHNVRKESGYLRKGGKFIEIIREYIGR